MEVARNIGLSGIQLIAIIAAIALIILAIRVAIVQYFIRYGVKYYFRMKSLNTPDNQENKRMEVKDNV